MMDQLINMQIKWLWLATDNCLGQGLLKCVSEWPPTWPWLQSFMLEQGRPWSPLIWQ